MRRPKSGPGYHIGMRNLLLLRITFNSLALLSPLLCAAPANSQ
jgi:hypothetical protein